MLTVTSSSSERAGLKVLEHSVVLRFQICWEGGREGEGGKGEGGREREQ